MTPEVFCDHYINGPHALCCHIALEDTGAALGFQAVDTFPHGLPDGWLDIGTFVTPAARGTGAGKALFRATTAIAKAKGYTAINATIRNDNALGLAYYTGIGFTDYAFDPDYALTNGSRVGRISKRFDLI